jgi:hypothetical protein
MNNVAPYTAFAKDLMDSEKVSKTVTPANAGVSRRWAGLIALDSRIRGNDENGSVTFCEFVRVDV